MDIFGKLLLGISNLRRNADEVALHHAIESFGLGLISIFIPIYFFDIGFSLRQIYGYYIAFSFFFAIFSFFSHKLLKFGFKKILMLRPISLIIFLIWLYFIPAYPKTIWLLALFNGIASGFYWVIFHCFYAVKTDDSNALERTGMLISLPRASMLFAPLIGGLIINSFGFEILFFIASFFLLLSLLPLLKITKFVLDIDFEVKNIFNKSFFKYFLGFISEGIYMASLGILFPMHIYLIIGGSMNIGIMSFFMTLSGVIVPFIVSRNCKSTSKYIKIFSIMEGLIFLLAFFVKTNISAFLLSFVASTFANFWVIPFLSRVYRRAKQREGKDAIELMTMREICLNIGRIIAFLTAYFTFIESSFILNFISKFLFLFF